MPSSGQATSLALVPRSPRPDSTLTPGSGSSLGLQPRLRPLPSRSFPDFLILPYPGPAALSQAGGEHAEGEEHASSRKERVRHAAGLHPSQSRLPAPPRGRLVGGGAIVAGAPPLRVPGQKLGRPPETEPEPEPEPGLGRKEGTQAPPPPHQPIAGWPTSQTGQLPRPDVALQVSVGSFLGLRGLAPVPVAYCSLLTP